jgi:hypothetical protein
MKKIIRLTESDLIKIINQVINEQNGDISPFATDLYKTEPLSTGKYTFKEVTEDKLSDYLSWYQGSSYPEIQEYISKTYGIPKLFDPIKLKTPGQQNSEFNLFKQFLDAVQASLYVAAKLNYNGKSFIQDYNLENLNKEMGNRFITKNWISAFEENLPFIGKLPEFKKFISKVIDSRRESVGVFN